MSTCIGYIDCEECGREFSPWMLGEHIAWHRRVMGDSEIVGATLRERVQFLSDMAEIRVARTLMGKVKKEIRSQQNA